MKKLILFAVIFSICSFSIHAQESLESVMDIRKRVARMEKYGQQCAGGFSKKFGIYIISVFSMEKDSNLKTREISELAILTGKKNIAAFIGQEMSASHEVVSTPEYEKYKSTIQSNINDFLRGVVLYDIKETARDYRIVCFATGRTMDMATELKKQISSLPPGTVAATGIAYVERNRVDLAKQQALQNALRLAIEQVLGTEIAAVSQAQDDSRIRSRIYANAFGFVEHYRIISESMADGYYKTALYAKISREKLLKSYSAYMKAFGNPEFFLKTENLELYQTFVKFFSDLGLKMTSDSKNADYIIDAFGQYRNVTHPLSRRTGTQLSLWIRISDTGTGQELLSQKNDPRMSSAFTGSPERQIEISTQKAFAQIRTPLHKSLNMMVSKMASNGRDVMIIIKKYHSGLADSLDYVSDILENMPGLMVQNKKISEDSVIFSSLYRGRMDDLEYFLRNALKNGVNRNGKTIPQTSGLSINQLTLTF